ncbi:MAG: hypothetical protein OEL89_02790 [Candidatus Peregrinibacteria bacterium]|nr:hypothetical protein [Candidatus Peregrinibacteria bacterium]
MIKVTKKTGESGDKLLKRFSGYVKGRKLIQKFRELRYFKQKPTKKVTRETAISREKHRAVNKRKQFL